MYGATAVTSPAAQIRPVAFVPGEAFGAPGYGRFSYALSDSDLVRGVERLAELLSEARE